MTYNIKGVTLDETEMREVHIAYLVGCITPTIEDRVGCSEVQAKAIASAIVDRMEDGMSEKEATEVVLCNLYS